MHRLSTCACNHLKAARLSFLSAVRFVKLYVTDTSGKNFSMQHCIVNLYRSVSKREKMPSGKLAGAAMMPSAPADVLWYNIVTVAVSDGVVGGVVGQARLHLLSGRRAIVGPVTVDAQEMSFICSLQVSCSHLGSTCTPRREMLRKPTRDDDMQRVKSSKG